MFTEHFYKINILKFEAEMGTRVMTQPTVIISSPSNNPVDCCCCLKCCNCLHLNFLRTVPGMLKIAEMVLGGMCESMLVNFGMDQYKITGSAYLSLLSTCTASVSTVTLLLICYIVSQKSFNLVRSSFFETIFNASAALSYLSASSYMAVTVNMYLYPLYLVVPGFVAYPAMISAYMMGITLTLIHSVDAYYCYRYFKGYR